MTEWFLASLFPIMASSLAMLGVVVHIYPRQESYDVEFKTLAGQTDAIVTSSANKLGRSVPNARVNWRTDRIDL